jgi:oligosaccharide repeat unit polymerase
VVAAVPAAYQHVRGLLPGVTLSELLYAARYVDTRAAGVGAAPVLGPFANLAPLSIALTLLLYAAPLPPGKRWIRSTMLLAALVTTVLAGGRSGAVIVLISVLALAAMRGELRARTLVGLGALFLTVFFAVALLVGKGGAGLDVSLEENVRLLLQGLRDYAVGGVVGFQRILLSPGEVASIGGATRTAAQILNHLGFHFGVPDPYPVFTMIGSGSDTNVYTIYYTYFDYGAAGALGLIFVLGGLVEVMFSRARAGGTMALAVYSSLVAGMVTSVFAESFFTNINFLGKLLLCGFVLLKPLGDRSNDPSLLHS